MGIYSDFVGIEMRSYDPPIPGKPQQIQQPPQYFTMVEGAQPQMQRCYQQPTQPPQPSQPPVHIVHQNEPLQPPQHQIHMPPQPPHNKPLQPPQHQVQITIQAPQHQIQPPHNLPLQPPQHQVQIPLQLPQHQVQMPPQPLQNLPLSPPQHQVQMPHQPALNKQTQPLNKRGRYPLRPSQPPQQYNVYQQPRQNQSEQNLKNPQPQEYTAIEMDFMEQQSLSQLQQNARQPTQTQQHPPFMQPMMMQSPLPQQQVHTQMMPLTNVQQQPVQPQPYSASLREQPNLQIQQPKQPQPSNLQQHPTQQRMQQPPQPQPVPMPQLYPSVAQQQPQPSYPNQHVLQQQYPSPPTQLQPSMQTQPPPPQPYAPMQDQHRYPPPPTQQQLQHAAMQHQQLYPPPSQQQHCDPIPSVVEILKKDQLSTSGFFMTDDRENAPPFATTRFISVDRGNANPRFIRSSMYRIPSTRELKKKIGIPFAIVINPFALPAEGERCVPVVKIGEEPPRCNNCSSYICSFTEFIDGGGKMKCAFCGSTSQVPSAYFCHLDQTGQRLDKLNRPELCLGSYDVVVPGSFYVNPKPKPPAFIFVIDVSNNSVQKGLVSVLCKNMTNIIKHFPVEPGQDRSAVKVGFITYSDQIHFYYFKKFGLSQKIVGDLEDVFLPDLEGFLCDPSESENLLEQLMLEIPKNFEKSYEAETVLGPAIQAGLEALTALECNGKVMVFNMAHPKHGTPGELKQGNVPKTLAEKDTPFKQLEFYRNLGYLYRDRRCLVDLFICNHSYIDILAVGQTAFLSGGQVFKYPAFQAMEHGFQLVQDVMKTVESTIALANEMRIRMSSGIAVENCYGQFYIPVHHHLRASGTDRNQALTVELVQNKDYVDRELIYIQVATLHTTTLGQHRLRIHNLALSVTSSMEEVFRCCDVDVFMNLFMKKSIADMTSHKKFDEQIIPAVVDIFKAYRRCYIPGQYDPMSWPEKLELIPIYAKSIKGCDAFASQSVEQRMYHILISRTMDVSASQVYLYPRLMALLEQPEGEDDLPPLIRCRKDFIKAGGVYLLENGINLFLWVGSGVATEWVNAVFGNDSQARSTQKLPELDNIYSRKVRGIVTRIQGSRHRVMPLTIVFSPHNNPCFKYLVEDPTEMYFSFVKLLEK